MEARLQHSELQANLCGLTQTLIRKLEDDVKPFADPMMQTFLQMFASSSSGQNATILEDALLAVGSLTTTLEKDFVRYMDAFLPFLYAGLQNHQEYQVSHSIERTNHQSSPTKSLNTIFFFQFRFVLFPLDWLVISAAPWARESFLIATPS